MTKLMTAEEWVDDQEKNNEDVWSRRNYTEDAQAYAEYLTEHLQEEIDILKSDEFYKKLGNEISLLSLRLKHKQLRVEKLEKENKELREETVFKDKPKYIPWEDVPVGHEFEVLSGGATRLKVSNKQWFNYDDECMYNKDHGHTTTEWIIAHRPRGEK